MKKNRRKVSSNIRIKEIVQVCSLLLALMLILIPTMSQANGNQEIIIESNKQELVKGEEINVIVKSNIKNDSKIQTITGKFEYDKSLLEIVSLEDDAELGKTEDKGNWTTILGKKESKFVSQSTNAESGEMFIATFKVLEDNKDTKITISELALTDENYQITELTTSEVELQGNKTINYIFIAIAIVLIIVIITVIMVLMRKKAKKQ